MQIDIARAWKDTQYRESLSAEEKAMLPENPAGSLELADNELVAIHSGIEYFLGNSFDLDDWFGYSDGFYGRGFVHNSEVYPGMHGSLRL